MAPELEISRQIESYYAELHTQIMASRNPTMPFTTYSLHNGFSSGEGPYQPVLGLRKMAEHVASIVDIRPHQRVLDQGCGVGSIAFYLAAAYPSSRVVAANITSAQLNYAHEIKSARTNRGEDWTNLSFCGGNYVQNPFLDRTFERVLFVDSFSHSPDTKKTIQEAKRVLAPDGRLVIFDYFSLDPTDPGVKKFRDLWMAPGLITPEDLEQTVQANFDTVEVTQITDKVKAGLKYLTEVRIPAVSPGFMAEGGKLLNSLIEEGKVGYFQVIAE